MGAAHTFICLLASFSIAHASITIYYPPGQAPASAASSTTQAAAANYTGAAAYNPTILNPPPLPNPLPPMNFDLQLSSGQAGVSIQQTGAFLGFSIEMSVVNQVCMYYSIFTDIRC